MPSIMESILSQLGPQGVSQIARQLGVDERVAEQGVQIGVPVLLSALARNAETPAGAASLSRALRNDHDGSVLGNLSEVLGGYQQLGGDRILGHVLGNERQQVEQGLTQQTGLNGGALLQMLAPIVLGQLGASQRSSGMDAGDLANLLAGERQQLSGGGGLFDLLGSLLGGGASGSAGGIPGMGDILGGGGTAGAQTAGAGMGGPIAQMIMGMLGPTLINEISKRFGIDRRMAQQVLTVAVPLLLAALARNASSRQGSDSLFDAVTRDHDGSVLNNIGEVLDNPAGRKGDKIVKKVLGNQAPSIEQVLTQQTGLNGGQLLQSLAPIVMGVLGMQTRQNNLDANGLSSVLRNEEQALTQSNPPVMDVVGQLLGGGQSARGGDALGGLLSQLLQG